MVMKNQKLQLILHIITQVNIRIPVNIMNLIYLKNFSHLCLEVDGKILILTKMIILKMKINATVQNAAIQAVKTISIRIEMNLHLLRNILVSIAKVCSPLKLKRILT